MDNRIDTIRDIREFNRFYTNILGLLDRHILASGYSLTEARILYELNETEQCIANALSMQLNIDKSYLSRILVGFERNGIVHREVSGDDSRSYSIKLTTKGKESFRALNEKSNHQMHQLLFLLSDKDCSTVRASMDTIRTCFAMASSMTIRPYSQADIDFVIAHQIELYETEYGFTSATWKAYVADAVHSFHNRFDETKDCMFILEHNGVSSGCIAMTHAKDQSVQLRFFFLSSAIRGLGMGSRLMELALDFCREKEYQHVFLLTCSKLIAARHLYKKHGFQITNTHENSEWGDAMMEEQWDLDLV